MIQSLRSPSRVFSKPCHAVEGFSCEALLIEAHILTPFFIANRSLSFFPCPPPLDHADGPFFRHIEEQPVLLDTLSTALLPYTGDPWDQPLF
jgi:hypothetical protein